MFVEPATFARQMGRLAERGYQTLLLDEYAAAIESRVKLRKRFILTFDDAYVHVDETVTPILRRYRFSAVMFAPWAHLGRRNHWDTGYHPRLSQLQIMSGGELTRLDRRHWEVASHAGRHVDLRRLDPDQRLRELQEARKGLSELMGREVLDLAYPFGCHDAAVRRDTSTAGYRLAFAASGDAAGGALQLPRRVVTERDRGPTLLLKAAGSAIWLYRLKALSRRFRSEPEYPADIPLGS